MEEIPKYLCMNCIHYMNCKVNAGIMCDFVKESTVTYIERKHKNHILVSECDRFVERDTITGEILPLPPEPKRVCNICGKEFDPTKYNRLVCSDPKCKYQSRQFRKSRQRR